MLLLEGLVDELVELLVGSLEVVVDNDEVVDAGGLGVLELLAGLGEALLDAGLGLGAAAAQALLELLDRGWRDEDVAGGDARVFDLLDALPKLLAIVPSLSFSPSSTKKKAKEQRAILSAGFCAPPFQCPAARCGPFSSAPQSSSCWCRSGCRQTGRARRSRPWR